MLHWAFFYTRDLFEEILQHIKTTKSLNFHLYSGKFDIMHNKKKKTFEVQNGQSEAGKREGDSHSSVDAAWKKKIGRQHL